MRSSDVSFRKIVPDIENVPVEERAEMEIVEIRFPDGKVSAFPANAVNPESGLKYSNIYATKYKAFKDGKPDPDRVLELEREIAEKQAELDALNKPKAKSEAAKPDDKRVQENLGYGEIKPDEDPHNPAKSTQPAGIGSSGILGPHPAPSGLPSPPPKETVLGQPKHDNIV